MQTEEEKKSKIMFCALNAHREDPKNSHTFCGVNIALPAGAGQ